MAKSRDNFPGWKFIGVIGQAPGWGQLCRGGFIPLEGTKEFQELPIPTPSEAVSDVWTPNSHIISQP